MIISHSRRFLFIKSVKTAGTSVEAALSQFCEGDDVVTPLNDFAFNRDESGAEVHRAMNADKLSWWIESGIGQHVDAATMRANLPAEVWRDYFKLSLARNPWDRMVSLFSWKARNDATLRPHRSLQHRLGVPFDEWRETRRLFAEFVRKGQKTNDRFYVLDGELCVDHVIRYESLGDDLEAACRKLGISGVTIPRLKSGIRPGGHHYSEYYDAESKALVGDMHRNDVRLFGYRFEEA